MAIVTPLEKYDLTTRHSSLPSDGLFQSQIMTIQIDSGASIPKVFASLAQKSVQGKLVSLQKLNLVTSLMPRAGKTTIISCLALALGTMGKRVLLIDADTQRPSLHDVFDVCPGYGLDDLLKEKRSVESIIPAPLNEGEIQLLTAGSNTRISRRKSHKLGSILNEMEQYYD